MNETEEGGGSGVNKSEAVKYIGEKVLHSQVCLTLLADQLEK